MIERRRTVSIQTPEGIVFCLWVADPVSRFLAKAIDFGCVLVLSSLLSALSCLVQVISLDLAGAFVAIGSFVLSLAYPIVMEWSWRGQTVGKKVLRLQVVDFQGLQLKPSQVIIRNLMRIVDALPAFYLVGGLASLVSPRGQRLGDLVANTMVVQHPKILEPDLDQVLPDKYNSFRDHPHLAARLRQNASAQEAGIALRAIMRRDILADGPRLSLFGDMRVHFERLVQFPAKTVDGMSDEQYIRNVVDILYR